MFLSRLTVVVKELSRGKAVGKMFHFKEDVMAVRITVVIEYEKEIDVPAFSANTLVFIDGALSAKVIAVAFEDILAKEEVCSD